MPRVLVGELMDDPALDAQSHAHALRGLARINAMSGIVRQIYPVLRRAAAGLDRPLTITDIATGSADLPVGLLRRAQRDGTRFDITACDISPVALRHASDRAKAAGVELGTLELDVLACDPPRADVVMCALFLHHLEDDHVRVVLSRMVKSADEMVLVSDLRRGWWGTTLAASIPRLVTRSPVVHVDALRSARAALSIGELRAMMREVAGAGEWHVAPAFPARMLLSWQRTGSSTPS
ncbi:MAG: methyltransferase domain-containing protein [Phycisphaerales bacterium]